MAAATKTPRRKRQPRQMFMPYAKDAPAVVQPPAIVAEVLDEDEAFEILTNQARFREHTGREPEKWYTARFVAEIGRSTGRFKAWMSNHYAVTVHGVDPLTIEDRIMVPPTSYDKRSPWWDEVTARAWAIEEGLMTRRGVAVPYKPTGRPKGRTDSVPRQRTATMKAGALEVLAAAEVKYAAGATPAVAKRELAREYAISERRVARRLTAGRQMRAAGVRPITPLMTLAEAGEIIVVTYRLLMADGRRKNTDKAREDVAERLGVTRETVDHVLDGAPPAVLADTDNPHVMTRGEAQDIVAALGGEISPEDRAAALVADLTRQT